MSTFGKKTTKKGNTTTHKNRSEVVLDKGADMDYYYTIPGNKEAYLKNKFSTKEVAKRVKDKRAKAKKKGKR